MKKPYRIPILFVACAFSLSPAIAWAQMESDQVPPIPEKTMPGPTLTDDEVDWIENKCKLQHPISDENRQKCLTDSKQKKLDEKAGQEIPPTDEPMPERKGMPEEDRVQ